MKILYPAILLCGIAAAFGAGVYVGLPGDAADPATARSGDSPQEAVLRQQLALERERLRQVLDHVGASKEDKLAQVLAKARQELAAEEDHSGEEVPEEIVLRDVQEMILSIDAMLNDPRLHDDDIIDHLQLKLAESVHRDPLAMDFALARLRESAGTPSGEILVTALGLARDPRVEAAAIDLVSGGYATPQRLAGLELLDRLDSDTPEVRQAVLQVLRQDSDPAVLSSALYALTPSVLAPSEAARVSQVVSPLAVHTDPEIRRRSVISLSEWSTDDRSLQPVLNAMTDADPSVRAGAAYALGAGRVQGEAARQALVSAIANPQEDWTVREVAWRSLTQYPLNEQEVVAYNAFKREWERVQEGNAEPLSDRPDPH